MMKKLIFALLLTVVSVNVFAQNQNDIDGVFNYLNTIHSFRAQFTQEDDLGNKSSGTISLQKPYKFRIETLTPDHNVIVGNKSLIIYHDYELNETSHTSLQNNILSFLVQTNVRPETVNTKFKSTNDHLQLKILDPVDSKELVLIFNKSPLKLVTLEIIDKNSNTTRMSLSNQEINIDINKDEFTFIYPKVQNPYLK